MKKKCWKTFSYLSTYWWHKACLAVSRLLESMTRSALIKSFASVGASASNSSILGLELFDFVGWFKSVEPKPFPTDFKSLSLGTGKADKIHSIYRRGRKSRNEAKIWFYVNNNNNKISPANARWTFAYFLPDLWCKSREKEVFLCTSPPKYILCSTYLCPLYIFCSQSKFRVHDTIS